ncbi:hypothetical protein RGUI_1759 [Rhodovulum sp. P5]|nr:hypothetical protein RGUI_1759 [Rhodovulum sp. P5]
MRCGNTVSDKLHKRDDSDEIGPRRQHPKDAGNRPVLRWNVPPFRHWRTSPQDRSEDKRWRGVTRRQAPLVA